MKHRVVVIGSGNWGSAIARLVGLNCKEKDLFYDEVKIWVFEETITLDGEKHKLTEYINKNHENVKYLPGIKLPDNVIAVPDITEAVKDADLLVFVLPHQFVKRACLSIKDVVKKDAVAISLCKGFEVTHEGLVIISSVISELVGIPCGALMGANLAREVACDHFAEATIATQNMDHGRLFQQVFNRPTFRCSCVGDNVVAVEVCGALKNVIGVGAGFVDALGMGNNTKCAIIRLGLMEMMEFSREFYDCENKDVFFESCGIADLVTTCYGGRHAKLGKLFVETGQSFEELEQIHLNGQKLQGHAVAEQVYRMLEGKGQASIDKYPLMVAIYKVAFEGLPAQDLFACLQNHPEHM